MTKGAMLRTTAETLHLVRQGLIGYTIAKSGHCFLLISDTATVKVSVVGVDVGPRFECFTLAVEQTGAPTEPVTSFVTPKGETASSVLLREEYIEPFVGDPSHVVGRSPHTTQRAAKPGYVPERAMASCVVAYGLLIEGPECRLAVAADWAPFKIEVTTDEARIEELLTESEAVEISRYVQRYGFS